MKLVITSHNPNVKAGDIHEGLQMGPWKYGPLPKQFHKIIGPATKEEWIECNVAWGGPRDHLEMIADVNGPWYYYEIETD